nr:abhydrolase domain-containing protein cgi-58 [Ipomoea batatas]
MIGGVGSIPEFELQVESGGVSGYEIENGGGGLQPLRVKGWDRALVEFTVAMLTDSELGSKPPLSERLSEISCPGY